MKLQVLAAVVALVAGPAAAQGTFNPGGHMPGMPQPPHGFTPQPPLPSMAPFPPATAAQRRAAGELEPPKPTHMYDPPPVTSSYARPRPQHFGAKPCETSVFVNACEHQR